MNRGFYKNGAFGNNANAQQPTAPVQPQVQPAPEVQQAPAPEVQAEVPPVEVAAPSAPIVQEPKKQEPKKEEPVEEKHENIPFADPADEEDDEDDDAILEEFSKEWSRDVSDGNTAATNWENFGINVPLSDQDATFAHRSNILENNKNNKEALRNMASDMASDWNAVDEATRYFSGAVSCLKEALEKVSANPEDLQKKFVGNIKGRGISHGKLHAKYTENDRNVLTGEDALSAFMIETGGIRKLTLWNSGITLTLRNLSLDVINRFFTTINHDDYHYGREFGGFYYLFADLEVTQYIVEKLLPIAINGSNYKHYKDTKALLNAISYQDFPVIVWALASMMYSDGAIVRYVCSNPSCRSVHEEKVDLEKLRLNNVDMITDEMINHFKPNKEKKGWVDDEDLAKYRELLNLNKPITFAYGDSDNQKRWKINLKQASLADFMQVGKEFNNDLSRQTKVTSREEVVQYISYNQYRCYKPWIESIELTRNIDGVDKTFVVENTDSKENDKVINMLLDEFQQNVDNFGDLIKDYILSTKITHIAFYYPECPDCHTEPTTSYGGFIPYDPMNAFFSLGLTKLVRVASKQQQSNNGLMNS